MVERSGPAAFAAAHPAARRSGSHGIPVRQFPILPKVQSASLGSHYWTLSFFQPVLWPVFANGGGSVIFIGGGKGGMLTAGESPDVEGAMQVSIQSAGAVPGDRLVRNPGHPVPRRPPSGRTGARPPGRHARRHPPRPFGIGPGPVARWPDQWHQPPGGAAAGEAKPPGYARHPDYLVAENSRPAQKPLPARRSEA